MMIKFASLEIAELRDIFTDFTQQELLEIIDYVYDIVEKNDSLSFDMKEKYSIKKEMLVKYLISIFINKNNVFNIYQKLLSTEVSKYVYRKLLWELDSLDTSIIVQKFNYKFRINVSSNSGIQTTKLENELALVVRMRKNSSILEFDKLSINVKFKKLLKLVYPIPKDSDLIPLSKIEETKYTYSNEDGVLNFISVIESMLKNKLVEFGKTNEKPLAKTLNILKSSTGIQEFYNDTSLNSFAVDMLTRSFYFYDKGVKSFEKPEQNALKHFVLALFGDHFNFFITRIFLAHLKKVRYDPYYSNQKNLFSTLQRIIKEMPQENYVSVENILKFCKYKSLKVDIEQKYKVDEYNMEAEVTDSNRSSDTTVYAYKFYNELVYEPMLKASLFYLGALGLLELKYNDPISSYKLSAKDKLYISPWDSLVYIKHTKLGKYVFGFSESYEYEKQEIQKKSIKLDEYKPIITVDKQDVLMQAKLEPYTEKQGEDKYILSYTKIFRDCKTKKVLELKIDGFYQQIEKNPPQVFKDFFEEIMTNANMLKKDSKHVVIELNNNKKLLELFMKNKKIQETIIKAQGYRVMVLKENLPKLTKIVKENGFFIEF